jgi:hypothetical protein
MKTRSNRKTLLFSIFSFFEARPFDFTKTTRETALFFVLVAPS